MSKIIPAIDIINGHCVRLTKGNYDTQKIYNPSPLAQAIEFERLGANRLHVVDLDAARNPETNNLDIIEQIIKTTRQIIKNSVKFI